MDEQAVQAIKEKYLSGDLPPHVAILQLQETGLTFEQAEQKLCDWEVEWHSIKAFMERITEVLGPPMKELADAAVKFSDALVKLAEEVNKNGP